MDDVLRGLAEETNPEESFNAAIQGTEKVASATPELSEVMWTPETSEDTDMDKIAEADAQGRIMARAFFDEMNKMAVAPVAEYPADPGAIPNNPAVEVGRGELAQRNQEAQAAANRIIAQLTQANKVGAGEIATPAGVQPVPKIDPNEGNQPLAADIAKMQEAEAVKTGSASSAEMIVGALYNAYFGGEE